MTCLRTISFIAMLSAGLASPVFAQDAGSRGPAHHSRAYELRNFRGVYNRVDEPLSAAPFTTQDGRNIENFGFSGRDRSWVGGEDPSLNPAGN